MLHNTSFEEILRNEKQRATQRRPTKLLINNHLLTIFQLQICSNWYRPHMHDRFRFHVHKDTESNCGLRGDLHGKKLLLNGELLIHHIVLDEVEIANIRRVLIHEACYETVSLGPGSNNVLKIHRQCRYSRHPFIGDCESKFIGGTLSLLNVIITCFHRQRFQPTIDYFNYCSDCKTKALLHLCALNVAVKTNRSRRAVLAVLGDAGRELTGKHAPGLVDKYFEAIGDLGPHHEMHVP